MKKKYVAITLAALMAVSMVSGCSSKNESEPETSNSNEPVKVTVFCAYASEDPHGQYVYDYAEKYMEENPNVEIEITAVSSNDIYTKLASMATSPDDLPTMFFTSADQAPSLFDLGMMEDLNGWLDDDTLNSFSTGVVEACTLDDQMVFYPIDVQPTAVIYRKDRFEEAGLSVPTTWDEFLECAKALTKDSDGDGEVDRWGFAMVGSNNSSGQSRFMSYLWSNGFDLVKQDGDTWITDIGQDNFNDVFSFWTDMNNVYGVVPTGITETDYATAANYFAMEYASMIISGSNALGVAYENNPELEGKLGSFMLPGEAAGTMLNAEGYALCSSASDAEKEAAVDFMKFFTNNDSEMKFWQSSGKIPATQEGMKADYITGEDYAGFLQQIEKGCRPVDNFPGMSGLKSALGDAYSAVFSGEADAAQAVETLKSDVDTLLEDYN